MIQGQPNFSCKALRLEGSQGSKNVIFPFFGNKVCGCCELCPYSEMRSCYAIHWGSPTRALIWAYPFGLTFPPKPSWYTVISRVRDTRYAVKYFDRITVYILAVQFHWIFIQLPSSVIESIFLQARRYSGEYHPYIRCHSRDDANIQCVLLQCVFFNANLHIRVKR